MKGWRILLISVMWMGAVLTGAQQDHCPDVVERALQTADRACEQIGRNQICYGHNAMQVQARTPATRLRFADEGDLIDVAAVESLALSPWDAQSGAWGVALMALQTNLPETMPGQNVLFVLFGAVEISNAVPVADSEYRPMQAFYLQTGVGDAPCTGAPQSGLLVQTPEGARDIEFTVNGVQITLGSTVYFQAQRDDVLTVRVLEGQAAVTAAGETSIVPAGVQVTVPLDRQLRASGAPDKMQPYDEESIQSLPLALLDHEIEAAAPLDLCTVTMTRRVNVRTGPGTDYPVGLQSSAGELYHFVGQTRGEDGYIWYHTICGLWVREDLIPGDCSFVPDVSPPQ